MELQELINDYKEVCREEGYSECRFMYCERDIIAAEDEFDKFIPLAKKYNVGFSDLLDEDDDYNELWEKGCFMGFRIKKSIIKKLKKLTLN